MILIVGSEGAQGKRYQAILKYLGKDFVCSDLKLEKEPEMPVSQMEGIILASPTDMHLAQIIEYGIYRIPMLVEKPICKNPKWLKTVLGNLPSAELLSMVYQYRHLAKSISSAPSTYNYFRHGSDGLAWDCLQIIGLANSAVHLAETSPIWQCQINGQELDIKDMDCAYVLEVKDWLDGDKRISTSEILDIHEKVDAYAKPAY